MHLLSNASACKNMFFYKLANFFHIPTFYYLGIYHFSTICYFDMFIRLNFLGFSVATLSSENLSEKSACDERCV